MKIRWPGFDAETVTAIEEYLDMRNLTEIASRSGSPSPGLVHTYARGHYERGGTHHHRPMFEVFDGGVGSAMSYMCRTPCPRCDDWSRTAVCEYHPEVPLEDHQRQVRESCDEAWRPENAPAQRQAALPDLTCTVSALRSYYYGVEVSNSGPRWSIVVGA